VNVSKENIAKRRTKAQVEAFVDAHTHIQRWLRKIPSPLTKKEYARDMMRYIEAIGLSPAELIALKEKGGHEAEDLLDEFIEKAEEAEIGNARIWSLSRAIKSFYKWNYADLSRGAGKKTLIRKKPYRTPEKETLIKFMDGATLRDKALIQFLAATGISEGSVPHLKWSHVWKDLIEKPVNPPHIRLASIEIKGRGAQRYAGVEQHTFLTPTAAEALIKYKEWRERVKGEKIAPESPLFATTKKPLTSLSIPMIRQIFNKASKRTNVKFSPHDMRRYVQTQLEFARMQPNWIKKILRHKVKGEEDPYSRPKIEQLRSAYREATPYLDLGVTPLIELEKRQKAVERIQAKIIDGERLNEEDRIDIKRYGIRLQQRARRRTERDGGADCSEYKEIDEGDLLSHLQNGWRVVHANSNGKVIIQRG
jgi:integrase